MSTSLKYEPSSGVRYKPVNVGARKSTGSPHWHDRLFIVHRQSPLGSVHPSFRALSGRLEFMVRRHTLSKDFLSLAAQTV